MNDNVGNCFGNELDLLLLLSPLRIRELLPLAFWREYGGHCVVRESLRAKLAKWRGRLLELKLFWFSVGDKVWLV